MTDTNVLQDFFLGDATVNDDVADADNTPTQRQGTWWEPHGAYYASRGWSVKRIFDVNQFDVTGNYGSILVSMWVDVPAGNLGGNDHVLWDCGMDGAESNLDPGGYGLQITTGRDLEFIWRQSGTTGTTTLLTQDLDNVVTDQNYPINGKKGTFWHFGIVINMLKEGYFADLYVDGNLINTEMLPVQTALPYINGGSGFSLWATAVDPTDTGLPEKVMNAGIVGDQIRTSNLFAQRLDTDQSDTAQRIMADAMNTRQALPARGAAL